MKSEWREYLLGDLYNFSSGLSKNSREFGFGKPFLSFKTVFTCCKLVISNLSTSIAKTSDVLISSETDPISAVPVAIIF